MRLLICNDDGVFALGIKTLADTLAAAGHDVTVVCPDRERSATGHGLTLHRPLHANPVHGVFDPRVVAWTCTGTPSDCVKLALNAILDSPPDAVLSGINHGPNLGTDVLYSGTVSAAMEGVIEGLPGIAFSLADFGARDFQPAADFALTLLAHLQANPLPVGTLLNVNVPPLAADELQGWVWARQGLRRYREQFDRRTDPRGRVYYWLAGEAIEEEQRPCESGHLTDVEAIRQGRITVVPLQCDLSHYSLLQSLPTADHAQG